MLYAFCLRSEPCSLKCVFRGNIDVSLCRWLVLVSEVHPVMIRLAVLSIVCSLLMLVFEAIGVVMVLAYSSFGRIIALYVIVRVSLFFPQVVEVSAFSNFVDFLPLFVRCAMCLL